MNINTMNMRALFVCLILTILISSSYSQNLTIEQTLKYINKRFIEMDEHWHYPSASDGSYVEEIPSNIKLASDGKIIIRYELVRKKLHRDYAGDIDSFRHSTKEFYPLDVTIRCDTNRWYKTSHEAKPANVIAECKKNDCVQMKDGENRVNLTISACYLPFMDNIATLSIANAMKYLIEKVTTDPRYSPKKVEKEYDPFAPENFGSNH